MDVAGFLLIGLKFVSLYLAENLVNYHTRGGRNLRVFQHTVIFCIVVTYYSGTVKHPHRSRYR